MSWDDGWNSFWKFLCSLWPNFKKEYDKLPEVVSQNSDNNTIQIRELSNSHELDNVFASVLLDEVNRRRQVELDFLNDSKKMGTAIRKTLHRALTGSYNQIMYMDIELSEEEANIFFGVFIPLCKANDIKAELSASGKSLHIDEDSFLAKIESLREIANSQSIDDKIREMFHTGIYR
jgi:hypothetical protein